MIYVSLSRLVKKKCNLDATLSNLNRPCCQVIFTPTFTAHFKSFFYPLGPMLNLEMYFCKAPKQENLPTSGTTWILGRLNIRYFSNVASDHDKLGICMVLSNSPIRLVQCQCFKIFTAILTFLCVIKKNYVFTNCRPVFGCRI